MVAPKKTLIAGVIAASLISLAGCSSSSTADKSTGTVAIEYLGWVSGLKD